MTTEQYAADADAPVPDGFTPFDRGGPYFSQLGPIYTRSADDGGLVLGLRVGQRHTNLAGITHGGMLTTLADGALGINIAKARKRGAGQVTVSLSVDFLAPAKPGDWLEAHVHLRRLGLRLAFADCILKVGRREVLRASAVFSIATLAARDG